MAEYVDEELDRELREIFAPLNDRIDGVTRRVRESTAVMAEVTETARAEIELWHDRVEASHQLWVEKAKKEKEAVEQRREGVAARPTLVSTPAEEAGEDELRTGSEERGKRVAARRTRALTPIAQESSMGMDEFDWRGDDEGGSRNGCQGGAAAEPAGALTSSDRDSGVGRSSGGFMFDRRRQPLVARSMDSPPVDDEPRGSRGDDVGGGEVGEVHADEEEAGGNAEEEEEAAETAVEEEPAARWRSARSQTVSKRRTEPPAVAPPAKKRDYIKAEDLPSKEFSLVSLLDSGDGGAGNATVLGTDGLDKDQLVALKRFWKEMVEEKMTGGDRFGAWFRGSTAGNKCLAMQMGSRAKCVWEHGLGFACQYCLKTERPCCCVELDAEEVPVRVIVLPQHGETGMNRFRYWE